MPRWYEAANEAAFKPVEGGYVFRRPGWIRYRHYLVNEAQKAEILVHLRRWRLLLLALVAITALIGCSVVLLWPAPFGRVFFSVSRQFGIPVSAVAMIFMITMVMLPAIAMQVYLMRGLRPLLAHAPLTHERITFRDWIPTIAAAVPGKVFAVGLVGGLLMVGGVAFSLVNTFSQGHLNHRLLLYGLPLIVVGCLLTAYFAYLIRLKVKLKREALINSANTM